MRTENVRLSEFIEDRRPVVEWSVAREGYVFEKIKRYEGSSELWVLKEGQPLYVATSDNRRYLLDEQGRLQPTSQRALSGVLTAYQMETIRAEAEMLARFMPEGKQDVYALTGTLLSCQLHPAKPCPLKPEQVLRGYIGRHTVLPAK